MAKSDENVSIVMMREMLNLRKETILSFFREAVSSMNQKCYDFQTSFQDVRRELDNIKSGLNFVGGVCEDKVKAVGEKINKICEDLTNVRKMQGKISSDNTELKLKSVDNEDRHRQNNLRIDGVVETNEEKDWDITKEKIKKLFNVQLGIEKDIKIERAHRVGLGKVEQARTIVLKLRDYENKKVILENAMKLKAISL
ncbi:uncharacterized protein LOC136084505 [Hydra vulgaris]|uniref:Uncharacterized protein LOC136084505 n=1 Tax=Hydra vulgaris TaxID=6087 RepID=A0ABM4CFX9_HYDVU